MICFFHVAGYREFLQFKKSPIFSIGSLRGCSLFQIASIALGGGEGGGAFSREGPCSKKYGILRYITHNSSNSKLNSLYEIANVNQGED